MYIIQQLPVMEIRDIFESRKEIKSWQLNVRSIVSTENERTPKQISGWK